MRPPVGWSGLPPWRGMATTWQLPAVPAQHTADPVRIGPYTVAGTTRSRWRRAGVSCRVGETGPVAVKLMHDPESDSNTVAAEFDLASRVDPAYTAAPVGFGLDNAGPYLVTT